MSQLVHALEALDFCAQRMDDGCHSEAEGDDVRAVYLIAGQIQAACIATPQVQTDPRVPVPDWLVPEDAQSSSQPQHERSS